MANLGLLCISTMKAAQRPGTTHLHSVKLLAVVCFCKFGGVLAFTKFDDHYRAVRRRISAGIIRKYSYATRCDYT